MDRAVPALTAMSSAAPWRRIALAFGLLSLLAAFAMPLTHKLFTAHMAQHVLLLAVAPPLIMLTGARTQLWRSLPRALTHPLCAWTLFNATMIVWHVPALYDLALRNGGLHVLEHCLFFGTGLLYWGVAFDSARLAAWWRIGYLTTGMLVGWLIALVLAFATSPLYSAYATVQHRPGGLSAIADQQLAAGVMWVPGSLAYTVAIIVLVYRWLEPESSARRLGLAGGG
jgi:cytochrome c oxidase assembly factor CtaG